MSDAADTLVVSEVFGPTFQGEGPSTGRCCGFVRLGRCNLDCSWCDTPYTWDWKGKNGTAFDPSQELTKRTVASIVSELRPMLVGLVVVSGGEPMLQARSLDVLVRMLEAELIAVEVETNGTRPPSLPAWVDYNVSPKLAHSGCDPQLRYNPDVLDAFVELGRRSRFKFVVQQMRDLDEVDVLVATHKIDRRCVWVMPEGRTVDELDQHMGVIADAVLDRRYNLTGRLHVQLWGDKRGV